MAYGLVNSVYRHFQQYFSYIVGTNFNDGENHQPVCRKSLTNFIT